LYFDYSGIELKAVFIDIPHIPIAIKISFFLPNFVINFGVVNELAESATTSGSSRKQILLFHPTLGR
jgi:hypothetical protein